MLNALAAALVVSKLKQKNLLHSKLNQWTNWLKNHYYQYDLSNSRWSKLVSQKWRNRITKCGVAQNKNRTKWDSYGKSPFILYKEQQGGALKKKIQKQYRYDLFSIILSIMQIRKTPIFIDIDPYFNQIKTH